MTQSTISATKMVKGKLFTWNNKNYLVESVRYLSEDTEEISVYLVDSDADFTIYSGSYSDFYSKLVQ
jgi:hypothetical protein